MIVTTDDVCLENLKFFKYWDEIKTMKPNLKVIAFTIANYKGEQNVAESEDFRSWFNGHEDWVEIGVHGYDHLFPPEQERNDAEELVMKSLEILKGFLPERYLYRPPGFQRTIHTEPMLKRFGFAGMAYQTRIKMFSGKIIEPILNTHCCDRDFNPITEWREWINLI